jgi:phosphosulfolactate synthase (CoM biosynthesis protein A)
MFDCLGTFRRDLKGMTMVLDKGLGLHGLEDLLSVAGSYVQIVKFGWGTTKVIDRPLIGKKIELIRARGIHVCPGGTFLEIAVSRQAVGPFLAEAKSLGFSCIEVSNGMLDIPLPCKLDLIKQARDAGFTVVSEVGKKTAEEDSLLDAKARRLQVERELEAGSWKIILEARESGSLGIFDKGGKVRADFVDELVRDLDVEQIIFEAPLKEQQVWLMRRFGSGVHLGNVSPADALALETLRQGLRADTFKDFGM